jgi:hypothetical protein
LIFVDKLNADCSYYILKGTVVQDVPRLLIFVLHDKSGQAAIAACCEKNEEDYGEESATIILAGRLKILRKL